MRKPSPYDKLTMAQAAEILEVSKAEVLSLMFKGRLRYVKIDGKRRMRRADVEALAATLAAESSAASASGAAGS